MSFLKPDTPSPPAAPDPQATASAQSASNIATAIANARLNRVNQTTPWGSITYTQGATDASGVPTYSSQIQLDPAQQQLLDQQRGQQLQRSQIAQMLLNQAGGALSKPLDLSRLHPMYDRYAQQNPIMPRAPSGGGMSGMGGAPAAGGMAAALGAQPSQSLPAPIPQGAQAMPDSVRQALASLLRGGALA